MDNRLGRGWKSNRRRCWWDDGRIRAVKALFTQSPSTVPILTSEFVIADRRRFNLIGEHVVEDLLLFLPFRWYEHLKDPGWFVGEHIHVFFGKLSAKLAGFETRWSRTETAARELLREIRNDGIEEGDRFTRVGDEDLWKMELSIDDDDDEEVKLDGKDDEDENGSDGWDCDEEVENLPEGEMERENDNESGRTGAFGFERDFEDAAIEERERSFNLGGERKWGEERERGGFLQSGAPVGG